MICVCNMFACMVATHSLGVSIVSALMPTLYGIPMLDNDNGEGKSTNRSGARLGSNGIVF